MSNGPFRVKCRAEERNAAQLEWPPEIGTRFQCLERLRKQSAICKVQYSTWGSARVKSTAGTLLYTALHCTVEDIQNCTVKMYDKCVASHVEIGRKTRCTRGSILQCSAVQRPAGRGDATESGRCCAALYYTCTVLYCMCCSRWVGVALIGSGALQTSDDN